MQLTPRYSTNCTPGRDFQKKKIYFDFTSNFTLEEDFPFKIDMHAKIPRKKLTVLLISFFGYFKPFLANDYNNGLGVKIQD